MTDKFDSFGIAHRTSCDRPTWATARDRDNGRISQVCRRCGITWRRGDGSLTPRPAVGYR